MGEEGIVMETGIRGDFPAPLNLVDTQTTHHHAGNDTTHESLNDLPMSPAQHTPNPFSRQHTSLDLDDYFVCPSLYPSRHIQI